VMSKENITLKYINYYIMKTTMCKCRFVYLTTFQRRSLCKI
jgi:hypothetical protein